MEFLNQNSLAIPSILVRPANDKTLSQQLPTNLGNRVDRHNLFSQQFQTSLQINAGKPTLVGGSAFDGTPNTTKQTYLIVEAIVQP